MCPRNRVCFRYVIVNILHKGDNEDCDDDEDDDDNHNHQGISYPRLVVSSVVLAGVQAELFVGVGEGRLYVIDV